MKEYPRVLIVTVNPLSTTSNNGKTYASFFRGYPKESLAQLYFHREIPDSEVCDNYYKISDENIIRNLFGKSKVMGQKVYREDCEEQILPQNLNKKLKKSSFIRFLRSLLWLTLDVEKDDIKEWLDSFDPEVIFFCGGNANYLYKKVLKLSKIYNSKIVYYITDDYVIPYFSFNIFNVINRIWTRIVFKEMCDKSALVLTIGDKMSEVYKEKYDIKSKGIMNLVEIKEIEATEEIIKNNNLNFVYLGGMHSNRWKTLSLIGESLERIHKKGYRGNLSIYSKEQPEKKILNKINIENYSRYCGSLDSKGVEKALKNADILIHVESFDRKSKEVTYLSISTKISEYMSSRKCILAIGPSEVASIDYLTETNSGFVITSINNDDIDKGLIELFKNSDKRKRVTEQAYLTAIKNHDIVNKRKEFQQDIIKLKI